ncbi:MAG: ankyrin repeat domain-containing protein [Verrucomicrobia bacterium]|nr:ankyrin repeat domain-containing protein [Verrucomicrobiota bacterium]
MKKTFTLFAAILAVGCSRETAIQPPAAEAPAAEPVGVKPVGVKPVAEVIPPEPPPPSPAVSIWDAARDGDIEAVRGQIEAGANLDEADAGDPLKPTPLHCAVASGHKAVAELLVAEGVAINAKRADGLTSLDIVLKADPEASDEMLSARKAIAGVLVRNGATAAKHK